MRLILTILAFVAAFPFGSAMADDECFVPMADWKSKEAVAALAAQQAGPCDESRSTTAVTSLTAPMTRGSGSRRRVHPATLEILKIETRDGDGHRRRERERHDVDQ